LTRRHPVIVVALLVAGLAGGCAHYTPKPVSAEQTLDDFAARRLDAPQLSEFLRDDAGIESWPPAHWDFDALTLAALYYSPELDVARAHWAVAQAGMITAGMRPNPTAGIGSGYNATTVGINPWIPEAVLDLTIETAGKRDIRSAQSSHIAEAARLEVLAAAWRARSRLRAAYVTLFVAQRKEENLAQQRDLRSESVRLLELQLAAGEISPNELTQARIALNDTRLAALDAASQVRQARIALAGALGVPVAALDDIDLTLTDMEQLERTLPDAEMRRRALVNRTDILAALADYGASEAALQLEVAKQYPDVHLLPGFQYDQVAAKWTLGVGFTLPIFNKNEGPIAEAEAAREEAAARMLAAQASVFNDIDAAMAAYQAATEKSGASEELLAQLREQEALSSTAYRLGEVSRLALLSAQLELATGELARLETLGQAQQAAGELENAVQSPLDLPSWVLEGR
jgi:outer membrane protein TolC